MLLRTKEGSLRDHSLQDVPISGLLAVQDGTRMIIQGSEIAVPTVLAPRYLAQTSLARQRR